MADPWAFGWTQVLTSIGLFITVCVSFAGLRTFGKWRREKLEEAKISAAVDGLSLAYESKFIFEYIRSPLIRAAELNAIEDSDVSKEEAERRSSFYAILKRIEANKDFFERLWALQPRFMAIFGPDTELIFELIHTARRDIELACEMLADHREPISPNNTDKDFWLQLRADICRGRDKFAKDGDRVGLKILHFREKMEALCNPVIGRHFRQKESWLDSFLWAAKNH